MNLALLLYCGLSMPILADTPSESIAIVDLRECLKHVPTADADRASFMTSIDETETKACKLATALKESDSVAKRDGSTLLQQADARLLKLEFEAYRHREQDRLRKAEQAMFRRWRKQVDAAVKAVAQRDGFTIVLYRGEDSNDTEGAAAELQQMLARTQAGFVLEQKRTDITKRIVAEMSTDTFIEQVTKEDRKSE